jgi:hypothetical protein
MICWSAAGTTVRALLLKGAASAGMHSAPLRKRPVTNCFMLIILLNNVSTDAGFCSILAQVLLKEWQPSLAGRS